ncbi:MAG: SDR family oxidoreductase [Gammaproteobacteria bacterium]|nr:SDR family oxidoreductase [Gammaproteobacteria bacterium]
MEIKDKVALITGGASGIGRAVAMDLAQRGVKAIALVDLTDQAHQVADEINNRDGNTIVEVFTGDVVDSAFREHVYDSMSEKHGVVNICIPAAGIIRDDLAVRVDKETGKAKVYPLETFRLLVEVDFIAPIYWAIEMLARIAEDRYQQGLRRWAAAEKIQGTVIFIGSVASQGNKGQIAYASSKAGLAGAASTLMKEAIFHGVRFGVIHPGFTDTPILQAMGEEYVNKYVLPDTQLGRLIRPEEIADAICFMISNSAVSGELWADAGWHPPA